MQVHRDSIIKVYTIFLQKSVGRFAATWCIGCKSRAMWKNRRQNGRRVNNGGEITIVCAFSFIQNGERILSKRNNWRYPPFILIYVRKYPRGVIRKKADTERDTEWGITTKYVEKCTPPGRDKKGGRIEEKGNEYGGKYRRRNYSCVSLWQSIFFHLQPPRPL